MNRFTRNRRTIIALTVGLAAVPTVVLAATDAVPGDPFKLGQDNHITTATTTLSGTGQNGTGILQVRRDGGSGAGGVIRVVNSGSSGLRSGIDIDVPANGIPIRVNPNAGKAIGLNADKLDGKGGEDFMPSAIYGNGTPAPVTGPGGGKTIALTGPNGLTCDDGDIALSAGGTAIDPDDDLNTVKPFRSSYQILFQDNGAPGKFSANIICMDLGAPHAP